MRNLILILLSFIPIFLSAQMEIDGEILYGNEWIDYDKTYIKVKINQDGVYRISKEELLEYGVPLNQINLKNLELFNYGKSVAFYVDANEDYIEFFGKKNRIEIDQFLYIEKEDILNPEYSFVSDEAAYFITWSEAENSNLLSNITTDLSSNTLQPEPYYLHRELVVESKKHYKPAENRQDVRFSNFIASEGYGSGSAIVNSIDVPLSKIVDAGESSSVRIRFGGNKTIHKTEVRINGNIRDTISHSFNEVLEKEYDLTANELEDLNINVELKATATEYDRNVIGLAEVRYPREFSIDEDSSFMFTIEPSTKERYFEIAGYQLSDLPLIYDLEDEVRILPEITSGNKIGFLLPPSTNVKQIFLVSSQFGLKKPIGIEKREFVDYNNPDYNYLLISSSDLRNQENIDWVKEYADYRASETGGSYTPVVANVDQLYDQFAYGVDRHFIAFRNFGYWSKENFTKPEFMFIIGKGREYRENRTSDQILNNIDAYVPTWGNPGSDNMILASEELPLPIFPIGRLAAKNAIEVKEYLDKVKEHDQNINLPQTIQDKQWQKKVVHLSGGDPDLQDDIAHNLSVMEDTLSNNMFGADVTTFYKKSIEAIEVATTDRIFELINNGLSIVTFFGHSSVGKFDFSIDNIDKYENKGKYPLVFSLGCFSGNIHTNGEGISEQFVVRKDRGAISFIAASGSAYVGQQYRYALRYYERLGGEDYGKPIGNILVTVIEEFTEDLNSQDITFLQQLTLHGDPAISLASFESVDVVPDASSIETIPTFVDTYEEDFEVCFEVANIGKYIEGEYDILIEHFGPDGTLAIDTILRYEVPKFNDKYCIKLPITSNKLVGKNVIKVTVDHSDEIDELPSPFAEANNKLIAQNGIEGFEFYILNNSANPIYPTEFSIVNESDFSLVSATYNAFGDDQKFIVQIDSTEKFNSPLMKEKVIEGVKGVVEWKLDFPLESSTVYYWRISPDSTSTGVGYVWNTSSFIYDQDSRNGWNQSHYFQFLKNEYENLSLEEDRKFFFATNLKEIVIKNKVWVKDFPAEFIIDNGFKSSMMERNTSPSIGVAVIDTLGKFVMNPLNGDYGSLNLDDKPIRTFYFKTDNQASREDLIYFLDEVVPDEYYVCVYNVFFDNDSDFKVPEWQADSLSNFGVNIFNYLEAQGMMNIRRLQEAGEALPFGFIYQKNVSPLAEGVAEERSDEVEVKESLPGFWFEGNFKSDFIGPAALWGTLEWNLIESSVSQNDTAFIKVLGYDINQNNEEILFDKVEDKNFNLESIDASKYPYLQVQYYANDFKDVSPAQISKIRVYYEGYGDFAVNSTKEFEFHADSLQQGDNLKLVYEIENFSYQKMAPAKVEYKIIDENNNVIIEERELPELNGRESTTIDFTYNTRELLGDYQLLLQLNPDKSPIEQYYFNNFGFKEFEVTADKINPLLDVRFDGISIMDQDIVSSNPLISIELVDENPFILLESPENFTMLLEYPSGENKQVNIDDPDLDFFPAQEGDDNTSKIEYNPDLIEDGEYKLTVEARDESNNISGDNNYEVRFRVYNEEMVSNVFNYPNPFSTSTQFIFTLTGRETPANVLIRIMTLSGKVVREITAAELGPLNIGLNRTEFKWDGRDEFGDRLGNGTYLYQVITKKIDGSDYMHFNDATQNNTDYLFKEGFGKLVIIR